VTVRELITQLERLAKKMGDDTHVFVDSPDLKECPPLADVEGIISAEDDDEPWIKVGA
jgi:hypothetical protein